MYIPKRYGESRIDNCPFCGKIGVTKNNQGIPVCNAHKEETLKDIKCLCGEWLDIQEGKFGAYFRCMNCGNISFKKAMESNPQLNKNRSENKSDNNLDKKKPRTEITVTSDQLDYLY